MGGAKATFGDTDFRAYLTRREMLSVPAKLNLRLKITGRRTNGFHELSMLNVGVSLFDQVSLEVSGVSDRPEVILKVTGQVALEDPSLNNTQVNLVSRVALGFLEKYRLPLVLSIGLHKIIPTGAGLGGGSADAAAVLRLLFEIFGRQLGLGRADLLKFALQFGADIPYCIVGGAAWVQGIGEIVTPLLLDELDQAQVMLVLTKIHSSSAQAYQDFSQTETRSGSDLEFEKFVDQTVAHKTSSGARAIGLIDNDFCPVLFQRYPILGEVYQRLCSHNPEWRVGMSGSGSALFVIDTGLKPLNGDEIKRSLAGLSVIPTICPCTILAKPHLRD